MLRIYHSPSRGGEREAKIISMTKKETKNNIRYKTPSFVHHRIPAESIKPTKECGSNEYYDSCGGQDCEPTCQEPDRVCRSRACFGPAYCACKKGFYRNKDGECVSEDDCEYDNMEIITFPPETTKGPKNCGVHEYYDYCGNECEPTCEEPVKMCGRICNPGACACDTGYFRNKAGKCVTEDECQDDFMEIITFPPDAITTPMSCPTNETYNSCGNICELKCEDIYEEEERVRCSQEDDDFFEL
ncbi:trypsin Inhibitor like cysteine rich domain protein [Ancylostoma ceylanicum]|uniref:Trypsin Inhibitor like cysteine rich domain protein n=1 Tax=Ancylostoma ceylanicum TaxID=53326 RepID=A0A0D6LSI2_9BILA|nr:trypsin Inhibitor like cysteine rich domain protein [Ancylostoma ceylanicum]